MRGTIFITLIVAALALMLLTGCATNYTGLVERTFHDNGELASLTKLKQWSGAGLFAKQEEGIGEVSYSADIEGSWSMAVNGAALNQDASPTDKAIEIMFGKFDTLFELLDNINARNAAAAAPLVVLPPEP